MVARSSSTCSGMPSLRSWTAATTWAGAGVPRTAWSCVAVSVQAQAGQPDLLGEPLASSRVRNSRIGSAGRARRCGTPRRPAAALREAAGQVASTSRLSSSAQCRSSRTISAAVPDRLWPQVDQVLNQQAAAPVGVAVVGGDGRTRTVGLRPAAASAGSVLSTDHWPGRSAGRPTTRRRQGTRPRGPPRNRLREPAAPSRRAAGSCRCPPRPRQTASGRSPRRYREAGAEEGHELIPADQDR